MNGPANLIATFWKTRHGRLALFRFILLFVILFPLIQQTYLATSHYTDPLINQTLNAGVSAAILNAVLPADDVQAVDARLVSVRGVMNIRKGCEGFEVVAILLAALLAYPMPWRHRVKGIVAGIMFVYALNLGRICILYLIVAYRSAWFDTAHVGIGQTIMIILALMFFVGWIRNIPGYEPG